MIRDQLDALLDRSAPSTPPHDVRDLDAMIAEAREHADARRAPRTLVAGGVIAVLLATGIGTAAATDGFSWAPWAQDPLGAVPFTMANGFDCELRFSAYTGGVDPVFVGQVNATLRDWYLTAGVLDEVEALVPEMRANTDLMPELLQPGETLEDLPPGELEHREWLREWIAWESAVGEAESGALVRAGIPVGDPRMAGSERQGQIQCRDLDGQPYVPGGGS